MGKPCCGWLGTGKRSLATTWLCWRWTRRRSQFWTRESPCSHWRRSKATATASTVSCDQSAHAATQRAVKLALQVAAWPPALPRVHLESATSPQNLQVTIYSIGLGGWFAAGLAWAPNSVCHLCTAGDDKKAHIWDIANANGTDHFEPVLAYDAGGEVNQVCEQRGGSHQCPLVCTTPSHHLALGLSSTTLC